MAERGHKVTLIFLRQATPAKPGDMAAFKIYLLELLKNEKLAQKMGYEGIKHISDRFTMKKTIDSYISTILSDLEKTEKKARSMCCASFLRRGAFGR